jgi:hypothetical protein
MLQSLAKCVLAEMATAETVWGMLNPKHSSRIQDVTACPERLMMAVARSDHRKRRTQYALHLHQQ